MNDSEGAHRACVTAWLDRGAGKLTGNRLIDAFAAAFAAIWRRARLTLGDVTLVAIGDRVLHTAAQRHPCLAGLKMGTGGLQVDELRSGRAVAQRELVIAIAFVLEEFLYVVGNLTADILTPALHAQLDKLPAEDIKP